MLLCRAGDWRVALHACSRPHCWTMVAHDDQLVKTVLCAHVVDLMSHSYSDGQMGLVMETAVSM